MIAYIVAAVSLLVSGASFYLNRTPTNTQFPRPVNLGAVFEGPPFSSSAAAAAAAVC